MSDTATSILMEDWGVHENHCCKKHGCKYSDDDCPVVLCLVKQAHECEHGDRYDNCFSEDGKSYTEEEVKDIIFRARTLSSDWLNEFYELSDEAANPEYNPCFKYTKEELL